MNRKKPGYCPSCTRNRCFIFFREHDGFYWKKCKHCGFTAKREIVFAHYIHKDGKVFLKSNRFTKLVEVEIKKRDGFLKVEKCQKN